MYKCGDYVVCKSGGVWSIVHKDESFIKLKEYINGLERKISVNDAEIVRSICSKETIEEAIDRVGFIKTIKASNDKARKEIYDAAMNEYDEISWISIIKTIYIREKDHRLMDKELEYSKKAKEYFHSEVSILLGIDYRDVEKYISDKVSSDEW
ncbi:MAG: hypothetical protein E7212_01340 [Clostridium sartagoforme]|nr:hypothetical protein [Clostridium sartagoforme]